VNQTDEIQMLGTILAKPAPSSETESRGRRQLQQVIQGRPGGRWRRPGRLGAGLGLAATATAGVVAAAAVLSSGAPPAGPHAGHHQAVRLSAAQQILLTAAAAAARAPAQIGAYWYDRQTWAGPGYRETIDFWTPPSGHPVWARGKLKTGGHIERAVTGTRDWSLAGDTSLLYQLAGLPGPELKLPQWRSKPPAQRLKPGQGGISGYPGEVSFGRLQKLPTGTTALKAWITVFNRTYADQMGEPYQPTQADFLSLTSLIAELPAPPAVRAAAFRAMATLPGVTSLGPVSGGQGLRLPIGRKMYATVVVNTATSQVRDILAVKGRGGQVNSVSDIAYWVSGLPQRPVASQPGLHRCVLPCQKTH
jgi:hypothetical protein